MEIELDIKEEYIDIGEEVIKTETNDKNIVLQESDQLQRDN